MPFPRRLPRGTRLFVAFLLFAVPGLGCSGSSPSEPGGSGPSPASVEASAVARVNESRRGDGKGELLLDPMLSEMARAYSRRMRDEGFFGHVDPQGGGLVDRLRGAGIGFSIVGENLAQVGGVSDPAAVAHRMLMENAAHRANILDARFTEVGIGVAQRDDTYWMTQVFLRP